MSNIRWLGCPACSFRFYIIEEQAGHGYTWFCPKCRHEFDESRSVEGHAHDLTSARPA